MWNLTNTPPAIIEADVFTRVPDEFAIRKKSEWSDANKFGGEVASFLEGPAFDRAGHLYVTDIPFGRIFRIAPDGSWTLVTQYDGWPNGIAIHQDGRLFIADYRRGLLVLEPATGKITGWIDLSKLYPAAGTGLNGENVMNGIAYDAEKKRLFVTGKLWPKIYEVKVIPRK